MTVSRIVANIAVADTAAATAFYQDLLGLEILMDFGWITTFGSRRKMPVQVSIASEGGSGTAVPGLSIEVDDLDSVIDKVRELGVVIEYGPVDEPWGVRRIYVRDPYGTLVNILEHVETSTANR